MAGMAKSPKDARIEVVRVENKKDFINNFNESKPSGEFFEECRKAGKLFKIGKEERYGICYRVQPDIHIG